MNACAPYSPLASQDSAADSTRSLRGLPVSLGAEKTGFIFNGRRSMSGFMQCDNRAGAHPGRLGADGSSRTSLLAGKAESNSAGGRPFNDCGGESVEKSATPRLRPSVRGGYKQEAERLGPAAVANPHGVPGGHRNTASPQSPILALSLMIAPLIVVVTLGLILSL